MIKNILFIIFTITTIVSCGTLNYQTIYLDKTLCDEEWHNEGASNAQYINDAEAFLLSRDIDINPGTLNLVSGGAEVDENCGSSCDCPTGLRLVMEVNKDDIAELLELDFYQE